VNPLSPSRIRDVRELPFFALPSSARIAIEIDSSVLATCPYVRCGDCSFVVATNEGHARALERLASVIHNGSEKALCVMIAVKDVHLRALETSARAFPDDAKKQSRLMQASSPRRQSLFGEKFPQFVGVFALRDFVPFSLSSRPHFAAECIRRRISNEGDSDELRALYASLAYAPPEGPLTSYNPGSDLARELDELFDQRKERMSAAEMRTNFEQQKRITFVPDERLTTNESGMRADFLKEVCLSRRWRISTLLSDNVSVTFRSPYDRLSWLDFSFGDVQKHVFG
jgi:hypothetical protein